MVLNSTLTTVANPTANADADRDYAPKQPQPIQPSVHETIQWLQALNRPPLPVAPAQDPHRYPLTNKKGKVIYEADGTTPKPRFTGKNPSYLDANNKPHLIPHSKYQKRLPNANELKLWFANAKNGIGTLGSDTLVLIDLDRHKFESKGATPDAVSCACDAAALSIIDAIIAQTASFPPYEQTQSGGWRIVVKLRAAATFTNFALTEGGVHVGEVLGSGRFAVLAPSMGPSGNPYVCYQRPDACRIPVVETYYTFSCRNV